MIKVTKGETVYNIPTNFDEITWKEYLSVFNNQEQSVLKRVSNITSIPEKELKKLSVSDLSMICEAVCFIDLLGTVQQIKTLEHNYEINIGKESYGNLEMARQLISQAKNYLVCGGDVWKVYFKEDISNDLMPLAMTKINFLYSQINSFLNRFSRLFDTKEDEESAEEFLAGADVFRRFGGFPTYDRLVKEWGGALGSMFTEEQKKEFTSPHDMVLSVPAEIVLNKLLYDFENGKYQENLFKLRSKKG